MELARLQLTCLQVGMMVRKAVVLAGQALRKELLRVSMEQMTE